jgi:Cys-tRNA(Pro)/Cys-tRNA(Cys) deacylase
MARKVRFQKTNAMRELEAAGVDYRLCTYEVDENVPGHDLGVMIAEMLGADPESQFKTLVTLDPAQEPVVCCIPVAEELDLKKAAVAAGVKTLTMIHVKDLEATCGYERGACSPVGMKKRFRTLIDETAVLFDEIGISGGRKGVTLVLKPEDLVDYLGATLADVVR